MSVLVTDTGFTADDWTHGYCEDGAANDCRAVDLASDADAHALTLTPALEMIRVDFPSFADGRGFTIARVLRLRGYTGRLRARGHVLADQYAMARRADWQAHDYQSCLRGASPQAAAAK